jgi:3-hydroxyisobutyrate dehydrogenase-like beta-hydroxyacid dehydrogenase
MAPIGFIGLGNMGSALAENLVDRGMELVVHDLAGADRCPPGATFVDDVAGIAEIATTVVLSLPDGRASEGVARSLAAVPRRAVTNVVDTSTVGVEAAAVIAALLAGVGIGHVDAPVSGGVAGARARTLAVMYAGDAAACEAVAPVLEALTDRRYRVGDKPGMAQALKLANNFLSATALVATSEAVAFCTSVGLDMATVLEVLNASSGRSAASDDKFVNHVLTGTYASGFLNTLMAKDLRLYASAVESQGTPAALGTLTTDVWQRFADAAPDVDFTTIYRFTTDG